MVPAQSAFDSIIQKRLYHYEESHRRLMASSSKRILIVDDESTCIMGIRGLLKGFKINVD